MTRRLTLRALGSGLVFTALAALTLTPGCDPADALKSGSPGVQDLDPCKTPLRVLATTVLERDKGKPTVVTVPFEVDPETVASGAAGAPVCVVVTSLEAKPRVLASGRFTIDDTQVLGPSAFNESTITATGMQEVAPGSHELHARLASAPGTSVRVHVLLGSAKPLPDDLVSGGGVVMPDKETTITVAGATLTFPPGAVDAPMAVTAFEVAEPYGLGNRIELLPDGMQFNKPVKIDLPYDPLRLPPTVTEAELLAQNAIQVRHSGEWRPTTVDSVNHIASATLEHFSHVQMESRIPLQYAAAGGELWRHADPDVFVARIPIGQPNYHISVQAKRLTTNPNNNEPLPLDSEQRPALELMSVREHIQSVPGEKIGINLSKWAANASTWYGVGIDPDLGFTNTTDTGIGRLIWTIKSTEDSTIEFLSGQPEYLMLIGTKKGSGLFARALSKDAVQAAIEEMNELDPQNGEHAVLVGSATSLIRQSVDANDTCSIHSSIEKDRQSVLAITKNPNGNDKHLLLISTTCMNVIRDELCVVLNSYHATDAILLDSGDAATLVHNQAILNENSTAHYSPARNVVNALAVSFVGPSAPAIKTNAWAGVNRSVVVHVTAGKALDSGPVKLQCTSPGSNHEDSSPYASVWLSSGQNDDPSFVWSTWGEKTIYCTTFDQAGRASPVAEQHIQIAQVGSIIPSFASLGTATTFVITGKNLPDHTVAWIPFCEGPNPAEKTLETSGNSQQRVFVCTPGGMPGVQKAIVKDHEDGDTLRDNIDVTFSQ